MWNVQIRVLQPGVGDQPGIDHQVGKAIHAQNPGQGKLRRGQAKGQQHHHQAEIGAQHQAAERLWKQGALAIAKGGPMPEVGGGAAVVLPAGHTEEEIQGPAQEQVGDQGQDSEGPSAQPPAQPINQAPRGGADPGRHMGFTAFEMVAVGMVHRMAALPGEVGHQQQAVQHEAHPALHVTVGVKGVVTALMGDDPTAPCHGAGDQGVEQPERGCRGLQGDLGAGGVGQQGEAQGHRQAAPGLGRVEAAQFRRQAIQQL